MRIEEGLGRIWETPFHYNKYLDPIDIEIKLKQLLEKNRRGYSWPFFCFKYLHRNFQSE